MLQSFFSLTYFLMNLLHLYFRRIGDIIEAEVAMIKLQKGKSGEFTQNS